MLLMVISMPLIVRFMPLMVRSMLLIFLSTLSILPSSDTQQGRVAEVDGDVGSVEGVMLGHESLQDSHYKVSSIRIDSLCLS